MAVKAPDPEVMRVVHAVGWYFPDPVGGTEVYVASVAREMRRTGIDVLIAAPRAGAERAELYEYEGATVFRYPVPLAPTRAEVRGETVVRGAEAFHEWLAVTRPTVVHAHTFVTGLGLTEIDVARATGARVFVTSHSSALGYVCLRGSLRRWGRDNCDGRAQPRRCGACALEQRGLSRTSAAAVAALPLPIARVANRFDHPAGTALGLPAYIEERQLRQQRMFDSIECFYALTEAARTILLANGAPPEKVRVNRLGVDIEATPACHRCNRRSGAPITIGFLGRLDPIKGIDTLLRATTSLPAGVQFRLELRGSGDDVVSRQMAERCRAAAARDARITVGPAVARSEVATLLASWDLLCCPGLSLEGGPTVALEAFAVGTPVIGSGFGGLAELVRDGYNGALVPPGDWRALATAIRRAAETPVVIDEWRRNIPAVRSMCDVAADYLAAYAA